MAIEVGRTEHELVIRFPRFHIWQQLLAYVGRERLKQENALRADRARAIIKEIKHVEPLPLIDPRI